MGDKMGYLIWLGGHVNRGIASYLKTKLDGVDYEEEGQYIILEGSGLKKWTRRKWS